MNSVPVGLCSRKRAEYLMHSAAVSGGAIYVDLPPIHGLTDDYYTTVYLCVGTLPSGEAVPTKQLDAGRVLAVLRKERDRLAASKIGCLEEYREEVAHVVADLEAKLGVGVAL